MDSNLFDRTRNEWLQRLLKILYRIWFIAIDEDQRTILSAICEVFDLHRRHQSPQEIPEMR